MWVRARIAFPQPLTRSVVSGSVPGAPPCGRLALPVGRPVIYALSLTRLEAAAKAKPYRRRVCGTPLTQKMPPGCNAMTYCPRSSHSATHVARPSTGGFFSKRTICWHV